MFPAVHTRKKEVEVIRCSGFLTNRKEKKICPEMLRELKKN